MKLGLWFSLLVIAVSAIFAIYGKYQKPRFLYYAFKPVTMGMIISLAWERTAASPSLYGYLILCGLCLSLLGDILLMLPGQIYRQGVIAFMAGYVFYLLAFSRGLRIVAVSVAAPILAFGALVYLYLYASLKGMRWPVLIYVLLVSALVFEAANRYLYLPVQESLLVLMGSLLLLVSESVWAVNKFKKSFRAAEVIILGTYFPAQLLFALSIR
jgi:uncharacterized membrane protein YhhN